MTDTPHEEGGFLGEGVRIWSVPTLGLVIRLQLRVFKIELTKDIIAHVWVGI